MKKNIVLFLLSFFYLSFAQNTKENKTKYAADKKLSYVTYSMSHPLHEWSATSKDVTSVIVANESKTKIEKLVVSIKVSGFDSKNANRDSHMMEVVEAIKYPNVTFYSTSIQYQGDKIIIDGVLNFHGKDKKINFVGTQKKNNSKTEIEGNFVVKITDFNLERPSIMGLATEDDIKLEIKLVY